MLGINEILSKLINKDKLEEEDKFKILRLKQIDPNIGQYLASILNNLYIKVAGEYEGSLLELMQEEKLDGWCWETTESAIIFFNNEDYIERGYLNLDEKCPNYYHSWICFHFNNNDYIFDPSLNLLCLKEDYYKVFAVKIKGLVKAQDVKDELIKNWYKPKIINPQKEKILYILKKYFNADFLDEITIEAEEDANTPFYRNNSGYKVELEDGQIRKLTVHYYYKC